MRSGKLAASSASIASTTSSRRSVESDGEELNSFVRTSDGRRKLCDFLSNVSSQSGARKQSVDMSGIKITTIQECNEINDLDHKL